MKLKCLACEALARVAYLSAARSPHVVDVELFRLGWHEDPDDLRARLQRAIDAADADAHEYDAVVMAYGLCGRSTAGLAANDMPLVIPRAHDCITLFLGGRARYHEEFTRHPGTYWYVRDYVERKSGGTALSLGADMGGDAEDLYDEYVEKYGEDNAQYLMEVMGAWREHYDRAAYIDMGVGDSRDVEEETRAEADRRGWNFEKLAGDLVLIRRLIWGDWDDEDFLILDPGERIEMANDARVVRCLADPLD
jgi:hypothetical protein